MSIGGPVTLESILNAFVEGLQIAVILLCFGAANSLASPYRLLRSLPAVLYETGVAVTVALSFTPGLIQSIGIVRQARRQRGIPTRGCAACGAWPSRCWRARWTVPFSSPRAWTLEATDGGSPSGTPRGGWPVEPQSAGLLLTAAGLYGVIDSGSLFGLGLPVLAVAAVLCGIGLALGGRRTAALALSPGPVAQARVDRGRVRSCGARRPWPLPVRWTCRDSPSRSRPWRFPSIPLLPVVGILIALVPAIAAPNPIGSPRRRRTGHPKRQSLGHGRPCGNGGQPVQSDLSGVSA